jgi:hypothetical protein
MNSKIAPIAIHPQFGITAFHPSASAAEPATVKKMPSAPEASEATRQMHFVAA